MLTTVLNRLKTSNKICIIEDNIKVTNSAVFAKIYAVKEKFKNFNNKNIAVFLPDSANFIAAVFGVIASKCTVFPLSTSAKEYELEKLLCCGDAAAVITQKCYSGLFSTLKKTLPQPFFVFYIEDITPASSNKENLNIPQICLGSPAVLLATSGTTGNPKIVQLSANNIITAALGLIDKIAPTPNEASTARYITATPFCSSYGLMVVTACLICGAPIIPMPPNFTPDVFLKTAATHRATNYEGGTSALILMAKLAGRNIPYDISALKHFGVGGSKLSGSTILKLLQSYPGIEILQGYGMTECGPLAAKNPRGKSNVYSVGTAIKGVTLAVECGGKVLTTPFTQGEVLVKGPNIMQGYYKNPAATAAVLKDEYLYTGDIGYLDENAYLHIVGRKKNIVIVNGLNVHPEEVEEFLLSLSIVNDCHVYGDMHKEESEILSADIVPENSHVSIEDIQNICAVHLAKHKQPRQINLCEKIEKNYIGKTVRNKKG